MYNQLERLIPVLKRNSRNNGIQWKLGGHFALGGFEETCSSSVRLAGSKKTKSLSFVVLSVTSSHSKLNLSDLFN